MECKYCGESFDTLMQLNMHKTDCYKKPSASKYICDNCEKLFGSHSKFESHRKTCNKGLQRDKTDDKDDDDIQSDEVNYICEHCGENFDKQAVLNAHQPVCGEDDTEYECEECGKVCKNKRHYENHMKNCGEEKSEDDSTKSSSSTPSIGKEIRKDKRGERKSGKNPFADTDRLKDAGLHKGGN